MYFFPDICNSSFVQFQIWDLPGQFNTMDPSFDTESIFGGCGAIIFVIDAQVFVYYVLLLEIQLSRRNGWDLINWFNSVMFVPSPSQDLDFRRHMSWSFFFVFREVIVRFVDIDGIDDHHSLLAFFS